ncbi:L-histidine N(alpha)-methyltransferase [Salegentibacter salegens]|uniref:Dimethylhistidine N-methyltransferase n=1 Tax=Salegentibacter salegens TaxID=143223 RepID=A0A1M7I8Z2_9FLAO|nr:L-histidine N(alpha)-methyltransferase [Salegentibacter salegens]PRX47994.1 dimethylhistidine N-methyltransferase [Salegentibacter salegens]SHM37165.1 dimethylhistidine N-methyltransferase [Salegentibacter salegens]
MKTTPTTFQSAFEEDVYKGLTSFPKYLLSKYIYDEKGDKLFQQIMAMPEYYLTNCELNILDKHKSAIAEIINKKGGFDLIELGAGDGKKTKVLLKELVEKEYNFNYLPIDISQNVLEELENSLKNEIPEVNVKIQQGTYFKTLENLADYSNRRKVILVLGSNIGNLLHENAIEFLRNIQEAMSAEDMLFMGFDQKKDPQKILDAYNDAAGITEAFNKNLLTRINRELDANFNPDNFTHWETYDPESGTAKSFLVSKENQKVAINKMDLEVSFDAWESIHTEISQKYDDAVVEWLAKEAGLEIQTSFQDNNEYYKNYIFRKKI